MGTDPSTIDPNAAAGIGIVGTIIYLAFLVFTVVVFWKVFTKAGQPGWAAIIPIYNIYVWLKVAGRPGWWLVLFLIPFVNIVMALIVSIDVAKSFAKDTVFGVVGLWLFSVIGYAILAFGGAQYRGPAALAGQQAAYRG
ncbi:DUF5684 domain-containing protein [Lentzea sp. DG1S-22]|uniref:DUF5684 domain-containing protein n=1 Tax=unclassified Lentzea TaxID=2643253 RepID=UPI0027E1135F|nr:MULTISPECIES: DUF5684 domain-containing protein [unclassified Lentzea]MCG8921659.1 DUF5684 domain-containing protein [Lentzea sp. CC55]WVH79788.1 DUF5684 domain-containing protein [Lentzea sp. DG1S-22]